ncbi:MAG: radical SAM family heme chaperone HemW, partial [Burkholderiales bacterium]|nr:radical SAM family heme chaperone HemW [Burkholderiales bacterium]
MNPPKPPGAPGALAIALPGRRLSALPPLSLYIHLPWCIRKCPYCDFNSHEARGDTPFERYVDALVADLEAVLPLVWGRRVYTVFIGGGTPSLFPAASIARLLDAVRARVPLDSEAEVTLEANPGTFEQAKFRGFRDAGVNRLSVGVQSFDAGALQALGRVHDPREAKAAVDGALSLFDRVNVDLMYALPGQTPEQALADVSAALELGARHVSAYQLTLEPNTWFHRYPPRLPDEECAELIEQAVHARLAEAGLERYEVSAFARPGDRARHNLNYW